MFFLWHCLNIHVCGASGERNPGVTTKLEAGPSSKWTPFKKKKKKKGGRGFIEWTDMFHIRSQNNDGFCSSGSFLSQNPTATTEVNHRLARGWLMALPRSWTGALKSHRSTFQTSNLSRSNLIGLPRDRRRWRRLILTKHFPAAERKTSDFKVQWSRKYNWLVFLFWN